MRNRQALFALAGLIDFMIGGYLIIAFVNWDWSWITAVHTWTMLERLIFAFGLVSLMAIGMVVGILVELLARTSRN